MDRLMISGRPASRELGPSSSRRQRPNKLLSKDDFETKVGNIVSDGLTNINNTSLIHVREWHGFKAKVSVAHAKINKNEIVQTWHLYKSPETVSHDEFKLPNKRSLQDAVNKVRTKLNHYANRGGATPDMKKRVERGITICARALERVHGNAPNNITTLLKPWAGEKKSGVYILGLGADESPKAGETWNFHDRVVTKKQEYMCKYIFMYTHDIITSGFVDYNDVEEFYSLGLPMFNGHHPDKKEDSIDKISRQFAEMIVFGLWEMKDNMVGEFVLQIPTPEMQWVADVSPTFDVLDNLSSEIRSTMVDMLVEIDGVFLVKTWPTVQSDLDKDQKLQYFVRKRSNFLKREMSSWVVDENLDGGFIDPYPESPFKEEVQSVIEELEVLLGHDDVTGEDIAAALRTIPEDDYIHPKNQEKYAKLSKDCMEILFGRLSTSKLIMMEHDIWKRLKSDDAWFNKHFHSDQQITISGSTLELVRKDDGRGEREVTSIEAQDIIICKTVSDHIVIVRGSSFLGLAVTATSSQRFNALRGLMDEGVVMFALGLLSVEGLNLLRKKVLSTIMILVGIRNSITRPDGTSSLARKYILGEGISESGKIPGSSALQTAVDGNTKNYYGILLLLSSLGHEEFNRMTNIIDGSEAGSSIKINLVGGKYMLYVRDDDNQFLPFHTHYDESKREECLQKSMAVLNGLGRTMHQLVPDLLSALFEGCNQTNNNDESRRKRLQALIAHIMCETEIEEVKRNKYIGILMDLPDFDTGNSSPEQWMEMFGRLKTYKENNELDRIENVVKGDSNESKYVSDWLKQQTGRSYKRGMTEFHTPVKGLKKQMLEEISVEFDLDVVKRAIVSNRQAAAPALAAAMLAKKQAAKKARDDALKKAAKKATKK